MLVTSSIILVTFPNKPTSQNWNQHISPTSIKLSIVNVFSVYAIFYISNPFKKNYDDTMVKRTFLIIQVSMYLDYLEVMMKFSPVLRSRCTSGSRTKDSNAAEITSM